MTAVSLAPRSLGTEWEEPLRHPQVRGSGACGHRPVRGWGVDAGPRSAQCQCQEGSGGGAGPAFSQVCGWQLCEPADLAVNPGAVPHAASCPWAGSPGSPARDHPAAWRPVSRKCLQMSPGPPTRCETWSLRGASRSLQLSALGGQRHLSPPLSAPTREPAAQGLGIKVINKADVASVFLTALPAR